MTTSESKGRFFLQKESILIDSHNESNRIESNRELECSNIGVSKSHRLLCCTVKQIPVQTAWTSNFYLIPHIDNPSFSSQTFGGPIVHRLFVINKCLREIVLTEQVLMFIVSAISCTLTPRFCSTVCSTARQFSSQTATDGRPDRGSSSRLLLSQRNSAAQHLTMAYDGIYST